MISLPKHQKKDLLELWTERVNLKELNSMKVYQKNVTTWLYFYLRHAQGDFFIDYNLLPPNYLLVTAQGIFTGWQIEGYPGTKQAREYFNDIIARFLLGFKEYQPERLSYKPNIAKNEIKNNKVYELKDFQNLPSIQTKKEISSAESAGTIDQIFWSIKIYTEEMIKELGEGVPVPYQMLEDYALNNFFDRKDKSTLRAKCRNIWNWYNKRDWTIPTRKKEWEMTRSERAKKNAELKRERARATLLGFIKGNLLANEYIKNNGSWNIKELSKATGLHRNTISKHLKEMREEGII